MKNTTQQPLKWKWTGPVDNSGKPIRLKWLKGVKVFQAVWI